MSGSILYIHGFNSAPASTKASQLRRVMEQLGLAEQLRVPALHHHPRQAIGQLEQAIAELGRPLLVGSSLGGYYATHLAERHGLKALLINPAVRPHLLLQQHLGRYYHPVRQQHYEVRAEHLPLLQDLQVQQLRRPSQYLVLLQSGDEVLDYRQALDFYQQCQTDVQEGGDHSYQGYANRLPDIVKFCQLA